MTASTATPLSPPTSALFPRLANPFAPRTTPDASDTSLSSRAQSFLANVDQQFVSPLSTQRLLSLSAALHKSYVGAASTSSAQMLPSHITTLPSGRESGQYVAVDLGGTNMRVALVRLQDNEATVEKLDKWIIPEQVKTGTAENFFQWVAERIVKLTAVSVLDDGEQEWKLGVTWSFPFAQNAVNRGTIHQMGKGFNIPNIVDASLTDFLHEALESLKPPHPIRITALLNDAVATLLSHAFIRPMTRMGLICGTGTNATCLCPTEYLSNEKYQHEPGARAWDEFVLVNTEWSMFGSGLLPVTEYDAIVDRECGMPGFQPFEMMVSGRYIGEIVRLVCLDGLKQGAWSFTSPPQGWNSKWALQTATCSTVEANADDTNSIIKLLNTVHPLSSGSYTRDDAQLFTKVSIAVSTRSASLVAASTIALLQVNNELCKVPERNGGSWTCGSTSSGTPSPSDSGLGSMDDDSRWPPSRRGSLFSAPGSRRGSLASPLSVQPKAVIPEGVVGTLIRENGLVTEDPAEMSDDDDDVVVVAFCGSVMEKYHTFRERCQKILDELVQQPCPTSAARVNGSQQGPFGVAGLQLTEQRRVVLEENSDGGILGAGILAAVVDTRELSSSVAGMAAAN